MRHSGCAAARWTTARATPWLTSPTMGHVRWLGCALLLAPVAVTVTTSRAPTRSSASRRVTFAPAAGPARCPRAHSCLPCTDALCVVPAPTSARVPQHCAALAAQYAATSCRWVMSSDSPRRATSLAASRAAVATPRLAQSDAGPYRLGRRRYPASLGWRCFGSK